MSSDLSIKEPWRFIDVPDSAWELNGWDNDDASFDGDPTPSRLHGGTVYLNGVPLHLEAIQVYWEGGSLQSPVDSANEDDFNALAGIQDGALSETTINGKQYVVFLTPHQR